MARNSRKQPRSDFKSDRPRGHADKKSGGKPRSPGKPFNQSGSENRSERPQGRFGGRSKSDEGSRPFRKKPEGGFGAPRGGSRPRPFDKSASENRSERPPGRFGSRSKSDEGTRPFRKKPEGGFGASRGGTRPRPFDKSGSEERRERPFAKPRSINKGEENEPRSFRKKPMGDKPAGFGPRKSNTDRPDSFKGRRDDERPSAKKSFVESRIDKQRKHSSVKEAPVPSADGLIRLNRFISNSGVCSRREADELITMGLITVNGKAVTELGYKVKLTDEVRYEGKRLRAEKPVYILLNKPKGYITTTDDPQERNTVMQLISGACKERVYPVGRLDRNTSGLLLLTNDGELTDKLTHPSYQVKKIYKAELDRPLTKNDFQKILDGVYLEEGKAKVDDLAVVSPDGLTIGLELHIGWNRIVRRIFEALGYTVVKLDRSVYATLDKKDLPRAHWRFLREDEVIRLKHLQ